MPEETETDDPPQGLAFRFDVGGEGCERCQQLDGSVWSAPPQRPHAYCQCDITQVDIGHLDQPACGDFAWDFEFGDTNRTGPNGRNFEREVTVSVLCWDGSIGDFEAAI